jgi:hypothetical protein
MAGLDNNAEWLLRLPWSDRTTPPSDGIPFSDVLKRKPTAGSITFLMSHNRSFSRNLGMRNPFLSSAAENTSAKDLFPVLKRRGARPGGAQPDDETGARAGGRRPQTKLTPPLALRLGSSAGLTLGSAAELSDLYVMT